jgi:hypothetical protein
LFCIVQDTIQRLEQCERLLFACKSQHGVVENFFYYVGSVFSYLFASSAEPEEGTTTADDDDVGGELSEENR